MKETSRKKRKANPDTTQQGRSQRVHRGTNCPLGKSEPTRKNAPFPSTVKTMASTCHAEWLPCKVKVTYRIPSATPPQGNEERHPVIGLAPENHRTDDDAEER